tara:strand:- start:7841 stop:8083 length:243 start_codon:yes stop_codon:yes gene_type:complete
MNKSDSNTRQIDKDSLKDGLLALHEAEWMECQARLNAIGYERETKGMPYDNPMVMIESTLFDIECKTEMLKKLLNQYILK